MVLRVLLLFSVFCVWGVQQLKPAQQEKKALYQAPPKSLTDYHFDYADMLASTFWVRLLQDMEICDQKSERELPSSLEGGDQVVQQILERQLPPAKCHLSWVYKMVDVVTDLDPTFYMAYDAGGLFLSVLVDDREGAQRIYEKGIHYFPNDWRLLYKASYHSLFEMQRPEEAARLLVRAGKWGAPKWVYSLAARLYTKVGQAQFAKTVLEAVLSRNPKGYGVDRVRERLKEIDKFLQEQ